MPARRCGFGRLRRRPLRGHAGALRRRKRPAAGAQASRLVSRPPCARNRRRPQRRRSSPALEPATVIALLARGILQPSTPHAGRECGMSVEATPGAEALASVAQIVLNTIRRPVIMIDARRFHHLRQCRCRGFLPLQRGDPGAQYAGEARSPSAARCWRWSNRCASGAPGQRIPGRHVVAAPRQSRRWSTSMSRRCRSFRARSW